MATPKAEARILTSYYRPKPGGLCTRLFRAIEALLREGHEVRYLAVDQFPIDHPRCHFHRFRWPSRTPDGLLFWIAFHLLAPLQLLYIGLRHRTTHIFAFGTTYALLCQPLRALKCIPLSLFLRADNLKNHELKGRHWLLRAVEKGLEGLSIAGTRLYGVSEVLTRTVVHRHGTLKPLSFGTLPNEIISISGTTTKPRKPASPLRLACIGIIERRKNISMVMRALRGVSPSDVRLYVFGEGPDLGALERLVLDYCLHDKVSLMGWRNRDEIWSSTDLLLFPSLHEGSPNAVLEAIANGIPVLASDIPEHREILPASFLLSSHDSAAWHEAIVNVVKDPARVLPLMVTLQAEESKRLRFDWDRKIIDAIIC